jgi:hypothetical protein
VTRLFAASAESIVAIDPDADSIEALGEEFPGIDARAVGIADLDLPAHSVDVAIFSWSL